MTFSDVKNGGPKIHDDLLMNEGGKKYKDVYQILLTGARVTHKIGKRGYYVVGVILIVFLFFVGSIFMCFIV